MQSSTSTEARPLRVLLVRDEREDGVRFRALAAELGGLVDLEWAGTFEAGLAEMTSGRYDAHLVDFRLGARSGIDLLRAYREAGGTLPVIMIAGRPDRSVDLAAMESGAADYLVEDRLDSERLERSIRYAVDRYRHEAALHSAREALETRVVERTVALETTNAALAAEVAERRRAEHALREADRRKNEFLATLAHELRNPLAPIRHATDILARLGTGDQRDAQARQVIERQVAHLVRLIDDLLDLSRITHGKLELRREWVPLTAIVESALETVRPLLLARRHAIDVVLPEPSLRLHADPVRLAQVLSNLLSNAAKYTEPGGQIRLEATRDGGAVTVRVVDSGIGIPAPELEHIFTIFGQATQARDAVHGGLGIGLALAKRLVELHGGSLTAASGGKGRGSTFTLHVPLGAEPVAVVAEAPAAPAAPVPPRRILVVDDNIDAALMLGELLALEGHETHVAYDGPSAVETAFRIRPDAVVLDVGLPGFDGHEVARRLRAEPSMRGLLLVALSGWVQPEDLARSREAGFDHHLAKPVDVGTLRGRLAAGRASAG